MKIANTNGVILEQVELTSLYRPAQPATGNNLLFLLWNANAPPGSFPLEDTWAASGAPRLAGFFLFLSVLPATGTFATFEQDVRKLLASPTSSAFAWVVYDPKAKSVTMQTLLKTRLNGSQNPCVDGDKELVLLPGQKRVGFSNGTPIFATAPASFITGFVVTYPALSGAQTPQQIGVELPMTGVLVGCVRFIGLVNLPSGAEISTSARKTLVEAAIDPLHPLDVKRNFERFTGQDFILTQDGDTYSISRAS